MHWAQRPTQDRKNESERESLGIHLRRGGPLRLAHGLAGSATQHAIPSKRRRGDHSCSTRLAGTRKSPLLPTARRSQARNSQRKSKAGHKKSPRSKPTAIEGQCRGPVTGTAKSKQAGIERPPSSPAFKTAPIKPPNPELAARGTTTPGRI